MGQPVQKKLGGLGISILSGGNNANGNSVGLSGCLKIKNV
jgi:hypothetical protein